MTGSYFEQLLEHGVRIYLYTPGFLHSKNVVCDDKLAVVGTINMDYRSLCLHFENACLFFGGQAVSDVRDDCWETMKVCKEIHMHHIRMHRKTAGLFHSMYYAILRLLAPLL